MASAAERNSYSAYSNVRSIAAPGVSLALSSAAVGCVGCGAGCCGVVACCGSVRLCSGGEVSEGFCARASKQLVKVAPNAKKRNMVFNREPAIRSSAMQTLYHQKTTGCSLGLGGAQVAAPLVGLIDLVCDAYGRADAAYPAAAVTE